MAVDDRASVYGELPVELRLFALGLGDAKISARKSESPHERQASQFRRTFARSQAVPRD
jgi:hypothetical protein